MAIIVGDCVAYRDGTYESVVFEDGHRAVILTIHRSIAKVKITKSTNRNYLSKTYDAHIGNLKKVKPLGMSTRVTWRKASQKKILL